MLSPRSFVVAGRKPSARAGNAPWSGARSTAWLRTSSTNQFARNLAVKGAWDGTLVLADYQTAGRGRLGRKWIAPPASSLLFSLILRPPWPPAWAMRATMAVALGVVGGIEKATAMRARLKWPNDILLGGGKAGGLLTETAMEGERLEFVIVGVGLNVNFNPALMPDLPAGATSLQEALGSGVERLRLLRAVLEGIDRTYQEARAGVSPCPAWEALMETIGKWVCVSVPQGELEGTALSVDDEGALILGTPAGARKRILAGDVSHLRETRTPAE